MFLSKHFTPKSLTKDSTIFNTHIIIKQKNE